MKIGEDELGADIELIPTKDDTDEQNGDTSCGLEEEGQSSSPSNALVKDSKPKSFRL